jgi:putative membrane protein
MCIRRPAGEGWGGGAGEAYSTGVMRGRGAGEGVRIRDHLANTRTLLAWLRAGLVLLGLGFVVVRVQLLAGGDAGPIGLATAAAGLLVVAAAGLRFLVQRRAIEGAAVRTHAAYDLGIAALAAAAGGAVFAFLVVR